MLGEYFIIIYNNQITKIASYNLLSMSKAFKQNS